MIIHWRQIVLVLEFAVLWTIAFIPSGALMMRLSMWRCLFVCSMQVESFRTFHGSSAYATTMYRKSPKRYGAVFKYNVTKDKQAIKKKPPVLWNYPVFYRGSNCGNHNYTDIYGKVGAGGVCAVIGSNCDYVYPGRGMGRGNKVRKTVVQGLRGGFEYKLEE